MLKKLNPAWLFSIVTLAIFPCFSIKSTIGCIFNIVGIGLGYVPTIFSSLISISTLLYLIAMVCFIILLFKNKYDTNMIIPVATMGVFKTIFSVCFVLWYGTYHKCYIVLPNMVVNVLFYIVLIAFVVISVIPRFENIKSICKRIWYVPAIFYCLRIILYLPMYGAAEMFFPRRFELGEIFHRLLFAFRGANGGIYLLAFLISFIEMIAILIFSYKLVNCKYSVKKARVKMDNLKMVNNAEVPNIESLSDTILKAIKPSLKAPFTAILCDANELVIFNDEINTYIIEGYVNSQNSFGAMISTDFTVEVQYQNDMWVVRKTKIGVKNAKKYAKKFAVNYIVLSIFVAILTAIGYFLLKSFVGM